MKKPNKPKRGKKSIFTSGITATLNEPALLKDLLEKLAGSRRDIGYGHEKVQPGWQSVETSSVEAHVSGDTRISVPSHPINMPFVTRFLFTCIKRKKGEYTVSWMSSLS